MMKQILLMSFICGLVACDPNPAPPHEWRDWVREKRESFLQPLSPPHVAQHLYVVKDLPVFGIQISPSGKFSIEKFDSMEAYNRSSGRKFKVNFETESVGEFTSGSEVVLEDIKGIMKLNQRFNMTARFVSGESKVRLFLYDLEMKDLEKKKKRTFFNYSSKFEKTTKFFPLKPQIVKFGRSDGTTADFTKVGELEVNSKNRLSVYWSEEDGSEVMLMFKDKTSGKSTYGAGRYLMVDFGKPPTEIKEGHKVPLNFNYAFNPPCAVSKGFHCPLAKDSLALKVTAGEKYEL